MPRLNVFAHHSYIVWNFNHYTLLSMFVCLDSQLYTRRLVSEHFMSAKKYIKIAV